MFNFIKNDYLFIIIFDRFDFISFSFYKRENDYFIKSLVKKTKTLTTKGLR